MSVRRLSLAAGFAALVLAACASEPRSPAPIQRGGAGVSSAQGSCSGQITVRRGDTLYAIARRCGLSVSELARENALREPYDLSVGQTLRVPGPSTYTVRRGQNLYRIALAHGMTTEELARLNGLRPPYEIYPGQELMVSGDDRVVVTSSSPPARPGASDSPRTPLPPPPPPAAPTSVSFAWPLSGQVLDRFRAGERQLDGIRIQARMGEPVRAAAPGVVAYVGNELQGYGELVLVRHDDRWVTAYGLNSRILVEVGQNVGAGDVIANAGATGSTDTPALHFEIRRGVEPVDPLTRLPQR